MPRAFKVDMHSALSVEAQVRDALVASGSRVMELFRSWDDDGDGEVSKAEFQRAMVSIGLCAPAEATDLVRELLQLMPTQRADARRVLERARRLCTSMLYMSCRRWCDDHANTWKEVPKRYGSGRHTRYTLALRTSHDTQFTSCTCNMATADTVASRRSLARADLPAPVASRATVRPRRPEAPTRIHTTTRNTTNSSFEASRRSARVDVCRRVTEDVGSYNYPFTLTFNFTQALASETLPFAHQRHLFPFIECTRK